MGNNLNRRNVVDPAVADILKDMEQKKRIASLPRSQRDKAHKDAQRHKVGLDIPPVLHDALRNIAKQENISLSGLVTFYLYRGVADYKNGQIELSPYKRLSRSLNFDYTLDFTEFEKT